jgi:histidinol-phosphate aminotransferase
MVSRTLSKSYALAGLRFGFLVAQPHLIAQFRKVKDSYNCDALSVAAATAAIDDQVWFKENRARVVATRERMTCKLRELGFRVIDSQANFVWCRHPEQSSARTVPAAQGRTDSGAVYGLSRLERRATNQRGDR